MNRRPIRHEVLRDLSDATDNFDFFIPGAAYQPSTTSASPSLQYPGEEDFSMTDGADGEYQQAPSYYPKLDGSWALNFYMPGISPGFPQ